MYSLTEIQGQSSLLHKSGSIEINTTYVTRRKPLWLVAVKLLGVAAMVAVGLGLIVPTLLHFDFVLWQAAGIAAGLMMLYMGVAFFVRPEANTDNLGWGWGGMADDPYQYSDDINRSLWGTYCMLGPGRFTAETLLDTCVLFGLASSEEVIDDSADAELAATEPGVFLGSATATAIACDQPPASEPLAPAGPLVGLSPNRFEQPRR